MIKIAERPRCGFAASDTIPFGRPARAGANRSEGAGLGLRYIIICHYSRWPKSQNSCCPHNPSIFPVRTIGNCSMKPAKGIDVPWRGILMSMALDAGGIPPG